jgi:hypothetical protein
MAEVATQPAGRALTRNFKFGRGPKLRCLFPVGIAFELHSFFCVDRASRQGNETLAVSQDGLSRMVR